MRVIFGNMTRTIKNRSRKLLASWTNYDYVTVVIHLILPAKKDSNTGNTGCEQ